MTFFYDLNKKLDAIREKPEVTHKQLNERDEGKPGKNFAKIAADAAERYGSKAAGERVAGAVRNKLKAQGKLEEESMVENTHSGVPFKLNSNPKSVILQLKDMGLEPEVRQFMAWARDNNFLSVKDALDHATTVDWEEFEGEPGIDRIIDGWWRTQELLGYDGESSQGMMESVKKTMSRAAKGYEKYGKQGMEALAKAGREGKALDPIRKKYDKYNNTEVDEGVMDTVKSIGKKVASGINRLVGHGSDEEMLKDLQRRAGAPVTGKKPTFADKIDNAKKEVDEMLGDVAAEAMRNALSPKQKKIDMNKNGKLDANDFAMLRKGAKPGGKDEMDEENAFTAHKRPSADRPKVGSIERGAKHDIEHTATGRKVTRRTDDQGISVGADDDSEATGEKRGRGRPKGTKNVGSKAKVFQRKSKLMTKEGDQDITDQGEYDQEGDMAKDDIKTIVRHAQALSKVLGDNDNLPEWVQSKLAKIEGMMISIDEYMQNQASDDGEEEPIAEKAVSKQQQKFMGMAHAMQKGEKIPGASKELKKVAKTMKKKDVEDFAKTKHKGLPDKVKSKKEEEVEESSTTSGSVAPSTASAGGKGAVFGKGIYDSINRELEAMIAESMNISMNMSNDAHGGPSKSLTVTATDEDAIYLGKLLKMAGLGSGNNSCGCGTSPCSCGSDTEVVDENSPDWPTNSETNDDALQYSGGVNGPKSTGQTVGAPFNRQASRQGEGITDVLENDEVGDIKNLAGIQETKKVEEDDVEEGNKFTGNLAKARAAGKEEADLDGDGDLEKVRESINNLWKTYRG